MAKNNNLTDFLTDIANTIRTKKGTTNLINPQNFSSEIESIETSINKLKKLVDKTITEVTADDLNEITNIGSYAFYGCGYLISITIPNSITKIGNNSFRDCNSLTSIIIPDSVKSLGDYIFYNCLKLENIILGNGIERIGKYAFTGCKSMIKITLLSTTPPTLSNIEAIPSNLTTIEVPADSLEAYQTATNWSNFADIMVGV